MTSPAAAMDLECVAQMAPAASAALNGRVVRVLVVEDDEDDWVLLRETMAQIDAWHGQLTWCRSVEDARRRLAEESYDVCLVDFFLGAHTGLELLDATRQAGGGTPLILLTGRGDRDKDVAAMLEGAADYLVKEQLDAALLERSVRYAIDGVRTLAALRRRTEELSAANEELEAANRQLKETQSQLIQAEKMSSLGQLVAGIAHEINNPLAFVLSNLFVVGKRLDEIQVALSGEANGGLRERLVGSRELLADVRDGAERVRDLVAKLRTFSRLEEGELRQIDVPDAIETVLLFLRHRMGDRIEVVRRYGEQRHLRCFAGSLNQVLMNVLANAVDALEAKGRITITTEVRGGEYRIAVQDTGAGIAPEHQARIFEPFFTTKPEGRGTGLGLAISYRVVAAHGGRMEVHSEEGLGTEMVVLIPLDIREGQR